MIRAARMKRLRAALLNRIGDQGDMEIRVRCSTVAALLDWAGVRPELMRHINERIDSHVEVQAYVLESLVDLSERRAA